MSKDQLKDLDVKDKEYIRVVHSNKELGWDERMSILMNKFQKSERTIRRWIKRLGFSEYKEIENDQVRSSKFKKYKSKYLILTWAQNATPVHKPFWDNMLAYAEYLGADIGVIAGRYQNPTSLFSSSMKNSEWWDEVFYKKDEDGEIVESYIDSSRQNVHPLLDVLADIKVVPTAKDPLRGFEGISGDKTSIIGHPSIHLKSLPVLKGHPNKLLLTTGACTIRNYSDTKEGKVSDFHHTYGFVIVELKDDETFYIRQVTAESDGSFTDLIFDIKNKKVKEIDSCAAFVMGDVHSSQVYQPVVKETLRLFEFLKPRRVVLHDLFNGESVNHHESKDPIKSFQRIQKEIHLVKNEIDGVYSFIEDNNLLKYNPIVVRSNHDLWLDRWISEGDWKKDVHNAVEYMEFSLALLQGNAPKGILPHLLEKRYGDKVTCLDFDDSFKINGWELGQHGHLGANGSKGNLEQYRKLNTKVITGDWHVPGRKCGAACVGTYSDLRLGYNKGASAWMHCGVIVHNNGKIQHIIFAEDDKFTTLL